MATLPVSLVTRHGPTLLPATHNPQQLSKALIALIFPCQQLQMTMCSPKLILCNNPTHISTTAAASTSKDNNDQPPCVSPWSQQKRHSYHEQPEATMEQPSHSSCYICQWYFIAKPTKKEPPKWQMTDTTSPTDDNDADWLCSHQTSLMETIHPLWTPEWDVFMKNMLISFRIIIWNSSWWSYRHTTLTTSTSVIIKWPMMMTNLCGAPLPWSWWKTT